MHFHFMLSKYQNARGAQTKDFIPPAQTLKLKFL